LQCAAALAISVARQRLRRKDLRRQVLYRHARLHRHNGAMPMARTAQDYDDIPGTFVFDAEKSRQGFGINMFCMSLMKDENRKAFKANEAEYLRKFPLTGEQTEAILKRDYNRMLELGGNIYFTAKLGATDGHSFRHLAAVMTGSTQEDYANMMLGGGRSVEGNRSRSGRAARNSLVASEKPAKAAAKAKSNVGAKSSKPSSRSVTKAKSKSRSKR
jgi:protocatechuate 4,5-dioxygenase alpha chain